MSTDWITPGAEVILYSIGGASQRLNVARTRIKRVATKSFTVEREHEPRFSLDRQEAREGGTWGWTRHCVPADSDKAREVIAAHNRAALLSEAKAAVDEWQKRPTRDNRLAAIAALQKVKD